MSGIVLTRRMALRHRVRVTGFRLARIIGVSIAGATCLVAANPAFAQVAEQSLADVANQDSVLARSKSNYDPSGIPVGSFLLFPSAEARIGYDSNIYNVTAARSDVSGTIAPRLVLQSQALNYNLTLSANGSIQRYAKLTAENNEQYDLAADGRLNLGQSANVFLSGFYGLRSELRGTLGDIIVGAPNQYNRLGGRAGVAVDLVHVSLSASGGIEKLDYKPVDLGNSTFLQDYRDRTIYSATARASVAVGPSLRVYAQGDYNVQDYRQRTALVNQDSHGYAVVGGVAFGLSELISGEVSVGYLSQRYDQGTPRTICGVTYNARVIWNPTTLLTATLSGGRTLEQSPFFNQAGILEDSVGINLDYELLRNVIISVSERAVFDDYRGLDRNDRRFVTDVSARLLISRGLEAGMRFNYRDQSSSGSLARGYNGTSILFSLIVKR